MFCANPSISHERKMNTNIDAQNIFFSEDFPTSATLNLYEY
jgi:hypothetical protein